MTIRPMDGGNYYKGTERLWGHSSYIAGLKTPGKNFFLYFPYESIWITNQDKLVPKADLG